MTLESSFAPRTITPFRPRRPIVWIGTRPLLGRMAEALKQESLLGLDVETTLNEPRRICTIQIATRVRTFVADALCVEDWAPFREILENPAVVKVIHNASFEEQMFAKYGIRIQNVFDTLVASRKKYRGKQVQGGHKLGEVCTRELGVSLDKALQVSDWTARPLTAPQLDYAAADAEVLLDLYDRFFVPPPPENLTLF